MARLGILAGKDYLPLEVAEAAKRQGKEIVIINLTLEGVTELSQVASAYYEIGVGQL